MTNTLLSLNFISRAAIGWLLLFVVSCQSSPVMPVPQSQPPVDPIGDLIAIPAEPESPAAANPLKTLGFSIQVGAFSQQDNAVRFEQSLKTQGLDAYSFLDESGLYKVRFGDYRDYQSARRQAEDLRKRDVIGRFFIVTPQDYAVARVAPDNPGGLRQDLVKTAKRFLGVPYRWGGEDSKNGFDCSGLTMVSYRLNGLSLPRNSRAQYQAGRAVEKNRLQQGDLVFFATKGGTRVTHVGMYVGDGQFIHAPRTGKTIRIASLSSRFFRRTYVGARTYL